jgi:hypothetical protein
MLTGLQLPSHDLKCVISQRYYGTGMATNECEIITYVGTTIADFDSDEIPPNSKIFIVSLS